MDITKTFGSKQAANNPKYVVVWHNPVAGGLTRCYFATRAHAKRTSEYMNAQGNVWTIWGAL